MGDIQSAQLSELQEYRDLHLVQADRVLLCVIGGVEPETLQSAMEKQLGTISLMEKTFPQPTVSPEIAKDQNALTFGMSIQRITWKLTQFPTLRTQTIPAPLYGESAFADSLYARYSIEGIDRTRFLWSRTLSHLNRYTYMSVPRSNLWDTDREQVKQRIEQLINRLKQPANNAQVPMYATSIFRWNSVYLQT